MCGIEVLKKLSYLLIILFSTSALCAETNSVITNDTTSEEVSLEDPTNSINSSIYLPLKNTTVPNAVDSNISESNVNSSSLKSDNSFTPSIHLGTIEEDSRDYETRNPKAHPFNNVQHFEYGNSAVGDVTSVDGDVGIVSVTDPQSVKEHVQYVYNVDGRDPPHPSPIIHHDSYPHHQPYAEGYLTIDVPSTAPVYYGNPDHQHHLHHHHPQFNNLHHPQFNNPHHHHHPHGEGEPVVEHLIYEKPTKYENLNPLSHYHHYEYAEPHNNEPLKRPEMNIPLHPYQYYYHNHHPHVGSHSSDVIKPVKEPESNEPLKKPEITVPAVHPYHQHYYHNNNHQPVKAHTGIIDKPETVLYLTSHRETSFTRTRKFPYKYYQPQDDTEIHLVKEEQHAFPPRRRQISPWHKIIHIIGAFLPLGLLIAALKPPNVIKIDSNNTDPNIVLSKLRGIQMPIEHKQIDNDNEEELCRDRSICQLILNSAGRNEKLIHKALGNFATRQSMKQNEARKSKFHEIFEAVRKKDCNIIKC
ncbi:hypothetical protein PV327_007130 [Microctonus hyperodae]|uniref:Uncharacterized protein n=1 Tax=Microctonus hyperodae TaxID=165561 RepID=A0AA39KJB6_MICHY|nr:hypothetical protein PV327_007130 [Microctonus hyperodae]